MEAAQHKDSSHWERAARHDELIGECWNTEHGQAWLPSSGRPFLGPRTRPRRHDSPTSLGEHVETRGRGGGAAYASTAHTNDSPLARKRVGHAAVLPSGTATDVIEGVRSCELKASALVRPSAVWRTGDFRSIAPYNPRRFHSAWATQWQRPPRSAIVPAATRWRIISALLPLSLRAERRPESTLVTARYARRPGCFPAPDDRLATV